MPTSFLDKTGLSYLFSKIDAKYLNKSGTALKTSAIPFAQVDSTSTSTAYTATVPEITSLYDGVAVLLKNGVVTSEAGFTININGLGAKHAYNNMTAATAESTIFNINYTMLFVYDGTRVDGGGWICYRGYDANTNTIGYQLRTNSTLRPAADKGYRYRLWFTSLDGHSWVPANTSTSTNNTAKRTPNTRVIDPFGEIIYYSTNGTTSAGANLSATTCWQQYTILFGYSFNNTGEALTLTNPAPVYIKCTPQTSGGVVMNDYVQTLPSTADGYVYIYIGMAYSATSVELAANHPVYEYKDGAIRLWTNAAASSSVEPATTVPLMNGTAAVGSSAKYARADHVHPSDTTRAAATDVPTQASIDSTGLISYKNNGGTTLFTLQLPVYVPVTLISFKIGSTSYQAEDGMTWGEWVESEYNTDGYFIDQQYVANGAYTISHPVVATDVIVNERKYSLSPGGGSN